MGPRFETTWENCSKNVSTIEKVPSLSSQTPQSNGSLMWRTSLDSLTMSLSRQIRLSKRYVLLLMTWFTQFVLCWWFSWISMYDMKPHQALWKAPWHALCLAQRTRRLLWIFPNVSFPWDPWNHIKRYVAPLWCKNILGSPGSHIKT
jgi:hypothetical protein